ncbi:MAG: RdgB/HAM1 family non-canonical purine NTP pyrophosphatase [Candidatus Micrarchaeota archaeon]
MVFFATSNPHKFDEAAAILKKAGIIAERFPFEHREMRSDDLEEVAREAVEEAFRRCQSPVFVEDSGLFVDALNGFPGTYSAWALRKIGCEGLLRLMKGVSRRSARFEACIAYHDGSEITCFRGVCPGRIAEEARGRGGFGYDPVFVPEGGTQTFSENASLKNALSHRYKSLLEFSKYFAARV